MSRAWPDDHEARWFLTEGRDDAMPNADLGANEFLFTGDRTQITFFPQTPGPLTPDKAGGELRYQGPEGSGPSSDRRSSDSTRRSERC